MIVLCTKDFLMADGELAFKSGKEYEFHLDDDEQCWVGKSEIDEEHYMDNINLEQLQE